MIWWSYQHNAMHNSRTENREKQSHDFNWFPERAMCYVLKRCKIGLLITHLSKFCMLNFKIYSFGQFRAPKTWFRAGHFGHARNPARNLDARNLAHPAFHPLKIGENRWNRWNRLSWYWNFFKKFYIFVILLMSMTRISTW